MVRTVLAAATVLLLSACGSTPPEQQPPPPPPPTTSTPPSTSTTTSTTTSTSSTPPTTTSHPFTAADGRNLKACSDGTCEVIARSGSVIRVSGVASFVVHIEDGSVSFGFSSGGMSGNISGSGSYTDPNHGTYSFEALAVQGQEAVIKMTKS